MSKKQTTEKPVETTPALINAETLALQQASDEIFERFENCEDEELQEQSEKMYLEFEEGELHNLKLEGIETMTFGQGDEAQTKDVAVFSDRTGQMFYNGNVYLVNRLKNIPVPNLVRIVCTGEEKSKSGNGKFKTFKVLAAYLNK